MMIASITCSGNEYFKDIDAQLGKSDSNAFLLVVQYTFSLVSFTGNSAWQCTRSSLSLSLCLSVCMSALVRACIHACLPVCVRERPCVWARAFVSLNAIQFQYQYYYYYYCCHHHRHHYYYMQEYHYYLSLLYAGNLLQTQNLPSSRTSDSKQRK